MKELMPIITLICGLILCVCIISSCGAVASPFLSDLLPTNTWEMEDENLRHMSDGAWNSELEGCCECEGEEGCKASLLGWVTQAQCEQPAWEHLGCTWNNEAVTVGANLHQEIAKTGIISSFGAGGIPGGPCADDYISCLITQNELDLISSPYIQGEIQFMQKELDIRGMDNSCTGCHDRRFGNFIGCTDIDACGDELKNRLNQVLDTENISTCLRYWRSMHEDVGLVTPDDRQTRSSGSPQITDECEGDDRCRMLYRCTYGGYISENTSPERTREQTARTWVKQHHPDGYLFRDAAAPGGVKIVPPFPWGTVTPGQGSTLAVGTALAENPCDEMVCLCKVPGAIPGTADCGTTDINDYDLSTCLPKYPCAENSGGYGGVCVSGGPFSELWPEPQPKESADVSTWARCECRNGYNHTNQLDQWSYRLDPPQLGWGGGGTCSARPQQCTDGGASDQCEFFIPTGHWGSDPINAADAANLSAARGGKHHSRYTCSDMGLGSPVCDVGMSGVAANDRSSLFLKVDAHDARDMDAATKIWPPGEFIPVGPEACVVVEDGVEIDDPDGNLCSYHTDGPQTWSWQQSVRTGRDPDRTRGAAPSCGANVEAVTCVGMASGTEGDACPDGCTYDSVNDNCGDNVEAVTCVGQDVGTNGDACPDGCTYVPGSNCQTSETCCRRTTAGIIRGVDCILKPEVKSLCKCSGGTPCTKNIHCKSLHPCKTYTCESVTAGTTTHRGGVCENENNKPDGTPCPIDASLSNLYDTCECIGGIPQYSGDITPSEWRRQRTDAELQNIADAEAELLRDAAASTLPTCSSGQYLSGGSCYLCAAGTYQASSSHTNSSCTDCPTGQYQNSPGQTACIYCSPGQYQDLSGQTMCNDCPSGHTSEQGSVALNDCYSIASVGVAGAPASR